MDLFAGMLLFFAAMFLGSVLIVGFTALIKVRQGRRDRLQMKQHLQKIDIGREA